MLSHCTKRPSLAEEMVGWHATIPESRARLSLVCKSEADISRADEWDDTSIHKGVKTSRWRSHSFLPFCGLSFASGNLI